MHGLAADPLGGSYYVEALTDELDLRATRLMEQIEEHGGVVAGIVDGSLERAIADSAYEQQRKVESGQRVIVGVNRFADDGAAEGDADPFTVGPDVLDRQLERLRRVRERRDQPAVDASLRALEEVARGTANTSSSGPRRRGRRSTASCARADPASIMWPCASTATSWSCAPCSRPVACR